MKILLGVLGLFGLGQSGAWAQESGERPSRLHLRNGNSFDGLILADSEKEIVLKLVNGELTIPRHLVERVELVQGRPAPRRESGAPVAGDRAAPAETRPPGLREGSEARLHPGRGQASLEDRVQEALGRLKKAPEAEKRRARQALKDLGKAAAPCLARSLETLDPPSRAHVVTMLSEWRPVEILPVLRPLAAGEDADLRLAAATVMTALRHPDTTRDLRRLLKDPDPRVRGVAVTALGEKGGPEFFDDVAPLARDADRSVRLRALEGILAWARQGRPEIDVEDTLRDALDRAEGEAKIDLLAAIGRSGVRSLWSRVAPLLWEQNPAIRAQAATALARLRAPEAGDSIVSRLPLEAEYWPRIQLAGAAQMLHLRAAIPSLIEWLGEEDVNVRMAASRALREISGQNFGIDRSKWAVWWERAAGNK